MSQSDSRITIGHSPDADDAFMFYPLTRGRIDTDGFAVEEILQDIETLNKRCLDAELDVSAASVHAYAYLADRYVILTCGASMGDGYGPRVVSKEPMTPGDLSGGRVAVPGAMTSAALAMKLFLPEFEPVIVPFDEVFDVVKEGRAEAGVVIHEGQLTYAEEGLHLVADLGEWWLDETGLPLPLGVNVARRDLGTGTLRRLDALLQRSVRFALDDRKGALEHAMGYARGLRPEQADRFVGMYVNDLTLDMGDRGRKGVDLFLDMGYEAGIIPRRVRAEFVG